MSAFSPRDLLSSSPREPLRSAWKCGSFHSLICINFSHYLCKWRRVSPAQCGGTARPIPAPGARRPPGRPGPAPASARALRLAPAPPARPLRHWICWRWQPRRRPERRGALLSGRLSRCHGKARGEWFSVAPDFPYLFSIRPTYLREKKQHVEGKWQAETRSPRPSILPALCIQTRGPYYTESSGSASLNYRR